MNPRTDGGQGLAEFALVIPIFLVVTLGVFDLGRVVWANNSLSSAAREAARFAIVHGGSPTTACPVGPPGPKTKIPVASGSCPFPSPSKQSIRDVAVQHAIAGGSGVTVTVCYGDGCSGDTDVAGATNVRGTPITVQVNSTVNLVAGSFLGLGDYSVAGAATMHVSH
jgi:TadE-like protein